MIEPSKYAYFVINDSDDLEELQKSLAPFGGVEAMKDVVIDYALDKHRITDLIKCCNKHDIIYTPYLARLGKSLKELYSIILLANEKAASIVFCDKPHITFNSNTPNGCICFASLQWAVELQEQIKSENTKSGLSRKKDEISRQGFSKNKAGVAIVGLGRPKGIPNPVAIAAAAQSRVDAKIKWRETSSAYKWTMARVAEGMPRKEIVRLFNEQHRLNPEVYCTRTGKPLTEATLSIWISEAQEDGAKKEPLADGKNPTESK